MNTKHSYYPVKTHAMAELAAENELNFLPQIYDVLKSIEKESHDITPKMTELKNQFQRSRECVDRMHGIQYNKTDQLKQIDVLRNQMSIKTDLLQKFKLMNNFELSQ